MPDDVAHYVVQTLQLRALVLTRVAQRETCARTRELIEAKIARLERGVRFVREFSAASRQAHVVP